MSKEMVFGWCKNGKHKNCRVQYGGARIVCICDAEECKDVHGIEYKSLNRSMSEAEIKHSIDIINRELAETTRTSNLENAGATILAGTEYKNRNRAIKETSTIWGPEISRLNELDEDGSSDYAEPKKYMGYYSDEDLFPEIQDADTIEELERRRLRKDY